MKGTKVVGCKVAQAEEDDDEQEEAGAKKVTSGSGGKLKPRLAKIAVKKVTKVKANTKSFSTYPSDAKVVCTGKAAIAEYITKRCKRCNNRSVKQCLGMVFFDDKGNQRSYGYADLKYDIESGRLKL